MLNKATQPEDFPEDRYEILDYIKENSPEKIMIIGGVDTGKTTLVNFLAKNLKDIAIIDGDIGQKSILPPATVSLAYTKEEFLNISELSPEKHYFIGSTAPAQFFGDLIVGIKKLSDYSEKKLTIIDTTGYIYGLGAEIKRLKIELIKPDVILALQKGNELNYILKPYIDKVKFLEVYRGVKKYNKDERKNIREEKWKEYFKNSIEREFNFDDIYISGSKAFYGEDIDEN